MLTAGAALRCSVILLPYSAGGRMRPSHSPLFQEKNSPVSLMKPRSSNKMFSHFKSLGGGEEEESHLLTSMDASSLAYSARTRRGSLAQDFGHPLPSGHLQLWPRRVSFPLQLLRGILPTE